MSEAINFIKEGDNLILEYSPDNPGIDFLSEEDSKFWLRKVFFFTQEELLSKELEDDSENNVPYKYTFKVGDLVGDYYLLSNKVFSLTKSFFFHKDCNISKKYFAAYRYISILKKIDELISEDFYVGGDEKNAIPEKEYRKLIKAFPNSNEVKKYANTRIASITNNFLKVKSEAEKEYQAYLSKKSIDDSKNILKTFKELDKLKLLAIRDRLNMMLQEDEKAYSETDWQKNIIQIVQLLFPKYCFAFREAKFKDINGIKRSVDYLVIDSLGNIDIIEIKKPFKDKIMSKSLYRDNHVPKRELSGCIMQVEKYIYYLNKIGSKGEDELTIMFKDQLPENFRINITNPRGIILMGREVDMTNRQKNDFEIVKRKYKNILDIFTYDDLLKRVDISIEQVDKL